MRGPAYQTDKEVGRTTSLQAGGPSDNLIIHQIALSSFLFDTRSLCAQLSGALHPVQYILRTSSTLDQYWQKSFKWQHVALLSQSSSCILYDGNLFVELYPWSGKEHFNRNVSDIVPATPPVDHRLKLAFAPSNLHDAAHWTAHLCATNERLLPQSRFNLPQIRRLHGYLLCMPWAQSAGRA